MGIFKRLGGVISANLNDLVDQFEDPEKLLKQTIREMEKSIREALDGAAKAIACERLLAGELASCEAQAELWRERARQAVRDGDEARARVHLNRKVSCDRQTETLQEQLSGAGEISRRLRGQIEAMQEKLREARQKAAALSLRKRAADARRKFHASARRLPLADDPFSRFDHLETEVEGAEADVDARLELASGESPDADRGLESEERAALVDKELEALVREIND